MMLHDAGGGIQMLYLATFGSDALPERQWSNEDGEG